MFSWSGRIWVSLVRVKTRHAVPQSQPQTLHGHLSAEPVSMGRCHGAHVAVPIHTADVGGPGVVVRREVNSEWFSLFYRFAHFRGQLARIIARKQLFEWNFDKRRVSKQLKAISP